jgi:agmatinase/guanidinopropionase
MEKTNPNPAFGAGMEPFHGIPTFMRLPASRDLEGVDVAVVGVPFDSGVSYRSGTRFGPRKIRESSLPLWGYNQVMGIAPTKVLNIIDYGDVEVIPVDIQATMTSIQSQVGELVEQGVSVIALGGDHSISLPLLRAHAAKYGPLAVTHFDSHPDTWDQEYEGFPYSHGTPFIRAIEEGLIDTSAYLQIGIRGPTSGVNDLRQARQLGAQIIAIEQAFDMSIPAVLQEIQAVMAGRPVYISLDIDALDPAYAPGTGTPEVGGFTSFQMLQLVRGLKGLNLVGFDLVEVSPPYDHSEITSLLAANLVFEFLSLLGLMKQV